VLDYAAGSYSDGYGRGVDVVHVRKVLFVKSDYWIVSDRLYGPAGAGEHEFASQFQFRDVGATVDEHAVAQSHNDDANLLIIPAAPGKFSVDVVEGQTEPPRGWIGWSYHRNHKTPASMVTYRWRGPCPQGADMVLYPYPGKERPAVQVQPLPTHGQDVTALAVRHEAGCDLILMQHRPAQATALAAGGPIPDVCTDAAVALLRYDRAGRLVACASGDGRNLAEAAQLTSAPLPAVGDALTKPIAAESIDEHAAKVTWESREPLRATVRYGHEAGGGYLYEKSCADPAERGAIKLRGLTPGQPYVFEAIGVTAAGRQVRLGEGRFVPTTPASMTFDDPSAGEAWRPAASLQIVQEGKDGGRCLKASAGPTAGVRYLSAQRDFIYHVTANTRVAFDYRNRIEHSGRGCYFKINVTDTAGEDWSIYLDREPADRWRRVDAGLAQWRQDTRGRKNRTPTMPPGAAIRALHFVQRKGQADQAGEQAFWVDNLRFYEAE